MFGALGRGAVVVLLVAPSPANNIREKKSAQTQRKTQFWL